MIPIYFRSNSSAVSANRVGNPQTLIITDFNIEPLYPQPVMQSAQPLNPRLPSFDLVHGYFETGSIQVTKIEANRFPFYRELAESYAGQIVTIDMTTTPQILRSVKAKITAPIRLPRVAPRATICRCEIRFRVVEDE